MFKSLLIQSKRFLQKREGNDNTVLLSVLIILISACSSMFFPFSTYAATLAIFGVPHVVVELRYIDSRFHGQISELFEFILIQGLLIIAGIRCFSLFGFFPVQFTSVIELCLLFCLVLTATYFLFKQGFKFALLGLTLSIGLGIGTLLSPLTTLILFAILHNLTPIGFIAKQFRVGQRTRALFLCSCIFLILPLVIFVSRWLIVDELSLENFTSYLSVFVPSQLQQQAIALPLFCAVTFLQCMHYAVVIGLFSQWTVWQAPTLIPWPKPKYFLVILLGVSTLFLISFTHSFLGTRAFYSIAAAIHAWVEIPLLLIALIPSNQVLKSN